MQLAFASQYMQEFIVVQVASAGVSFWLRLALLQVEEFDYFIRKDQSKAAPQLAEVKSALDAVRGALPV
jgi:hypothetical protein